MCMGENWRLQYTNSTVKYGSSNTSHEAKRRIQYSTGAEADRPFFSMPLRSHNSI